MSYLFVLLGITGWVSAVGLSTHTLVAYENKKQSNLVQGVVNDVTQKSIASVAIPASTISVPAQSDLQPSRVINSAPVNIVAPAQAKKDSQVYEREEGDEDEDEEDDD